MISEKRGIKPGQGVEIALVDTGTLIDHGELERAKAQIFPGFDFVRNRPGSQPEFIKDTLWVHGTLTAAAIISPEGKEPTTEGKVGITGVSPGVTLLPIRGSARIFISNEIFRPLMPPGLASDGGTLSKAIDYAVEQEVDIISLALGTLPSSAIDKAISKAVSSGILVVVATGHRLPLGGSSIGPVSSASIHPDSISVVGSDENSEVWDRSVPGKNPSIAAPAFPMCVGKFKENPDKTPELPLKSIVEIAEGGTSFSTSIVAGILANWISYIGIEKWKSVPPEKRTPIVKKILAQSAQSSSSWDASRFGPGVVSPVDLFRLSSDIDDLLK
jgi:subtilisin family serine protease